MTERSAREAAIDALLKHIVDQLPLLSSRPGLYTRHVAAGGLARCCALADGIRILCRANRGDVSGVLFRSFIETFLLAFYVLLGGHKALLEVAGEHKRHAKILDERNQLGVEQLLARWQFDDYRLPPLEQVAKTLGPMLQNAGEDGADLTDLYDLAFRAESTFNTHGLGAVLRYVDATGEPWVVWPNPGGLGDDLQAESKVVAYTAVLAKHVFAAFGVGTRNLGCLFDRLNETQPASDDTNARQSLMGDERLLVEPHIREAHVLPGNRRGVV